MLEIRKFYTVVEETRLEIGREVTPPITMIAALAVVRNPWAGRGFVDNLKPEIDAYAPILGEALVNNLFKIIHSADQIEAFGKAALVGINGGSRACVGVDSYL